MAFCRELSAHASTSQCLDMAAALEKVYMYSVCMTVYMCAYILCVHGCLSAPTQCCEVQWNILTDFEKQTRSPALMMMQH